MEGPTRNEYETGSREHSGCKRDSKTNVLFLQSQLIPSSWLLQGGATKKLFVFYLTVYREPLLGRILHETTISEAKTLVQGEKIYS